VATRFVEPKRTSPTANMPGTLVSKLNGLRVPIQILEAGSILKSTFNS
jgi:hypothetical protein